MLTDRAWLGLACWIVFAFGWERAWRSIDYRSDVRDAKGAEYR